MDFRRIRMKNPGLSSFLLAAGPAIALFLLASCGNDRPAGQPQGSAGSGAAADDHRGEAGHESAEKHEDEHEHGDADAGEFIIDIGEHEFLGKVRYDAGAGKVELTVVSHTDRKPHLHKASPAKLNLQLESGPLQFTLKPVAAEGGGERTAEYEATGEKLKGLKELKGRINLEIDGRTYVADLQAAH